MNLEPMQKAAVLIKALPYIQRFNRKVVVVKYGGNAMLDEELKKRATQDVVSLKLVGFEPIIAHGGGKEISKWINKVGMEAQFINGLRVTDEPTTEIAEMMLNKVNKSLVQLVNELGVKAVGISGKDGMMLKCHKKHLGGEDIGYVGEVEKVDPKIIYDLLGKDSLPIMCPVGFDDEFLSYNVNADDAACAIATTVQAGELVFFADVEGVYKDSDDKESLISEMTVQGAQSFVSSGMPGGGMLPKLQSCINAITSGVPRVHILGGRTPHRLLLKIFTDRGIGTAIFNPEEDGRYYHG